MYSFPLLKVYFVLLKEVNRATELYRKLTAVNYKCCD